MSTALANKQTITSTKLLERIDGDVTYRQLDNWCRHGYLGEDVMDTGSGKHRRFTLEHAEHIQRVVLLMNDLEQAGLRKRNDTVGELFDLTRHYTVRLALVREPIT